MSDIKNPLSAESYTNKDFQTIYVELLEAAKMLAKNWDPTISNESDPGVVLLKLNAIIADKNNYNIDKNVLENYPETYTQEMSARSQYKQLGYRMPWYKAATTKIAFKWVGDNFTDGDHLTIPKHTMLMDAQGNYVYTILEDALLGKIERRATNTCEVNAIQGTINTLKLAGSDVISLANLDSKNRLYINDHYIAENGIYITDAADPNGVLWTQVDNIELQNYGTPCYEFDIDPRRNIPYLQFPEYVRNLIKTGIVVKYIVTNGYDGNVAAKTIDRFYDQGSVELIHSNNDKVNIPLTNESFLLYNTTGTHNGQNPEDIDAAARNFKRNVCTFDTLITLRDYINAIYTFGKEENALSNIIVTDRTTDIQSHYRIIDKDDGLLGYVDHISYTPVTKLVEANLVENLDNDSDILLKREGEGQDVSYVNVKDPEDATHVQVTEKIYDMSAFDLKFYVLKTGGLLNSLEAYSNTFQVDDSYQTRNAINAHIDELKAIQHDIVDIKKYTPFMLQNIYPINIKLVPTFKLNDVAKNEVISNIKTTLIKLLNSRNCDFGEEPSYDIIYNSIVSCDERIKVLILDDFKYTTFATYLGYSKDDESGDLEFKYIPISDYATCSRLIVRDGTNCSCGQSKDTTTVAAIKNNLQEAADKILGNNSDTKNKVTPTENQIESYRFIDSVNGIMYKWPKKKASSAAGADPTLLELYSARLLDIRTEVIARNVLAGVTPLFDVPTTPFKTSLNMNQIDGLTASVSNIATSLEIAPFGFDAAYDEQKRSATYKLRANESLRFLAPSFISDKTYANYVKYELVLKNPVISNSEFMWADPQDEENIFKTYGTKHFYTQSADNVFSPLYGSQYVSLKNVPTFKLNYLHEINRGYAQLSKEIISNSNHFRNVNGTLQAIATNVKTYIPEYETHFYYKLEDGKFKVIKHYYPEFRSDLMSGKLYRLKHYVHGEESNVVDSGNCDQYDSFLNKANPRFESVKRFSSNLYVKMLKNNQLVGYKVVEADDEKHFKDLTKLKECIVGTYNSARSDLQATDVPDITIDKIIESGLLVMATEPTTWPSRYAQSYYVKYIDFEGDTVKYARPSAPPDYNHVVCLEKKEITLNSGTEIRYVAVTNDSDLVTNNGWDNNYSSAFSQESYSGLHTSSPQYQKWKDGSLSLFVRKASYKIEANTEYQLREGDYIIFFWRETDEDDAPYTYRKYESIYDEKTGQKTIIKPNFTINASELGNTLFNHKYLNESGTIPYSADNNSNFQIIYQKMYDQYDLSGSRQIELRKMNSVKLDSSDKKYYYFICPDKEHVNGQDIFSMYLDFSKEWTNKQGITQYRFQHILQPDEYFIYMNDDQTLYEILGEGTLVEYNTSTPTPAGKGTQKKLEVIAIDSNEILYDGANAFKEYCKVIENNEVFNLIEQQVYSFVKGDTVQVALKSNVGYHYIPASKDDGTWYLNYSMEVVSTSITNQSGIDVEVVEPFVYGDYYTIKPGTVGRRFEYYEKVLLKPNGWDILQNWRDGGINHNKYYKILYADFVEKSNLDLGSNLNDNNWYIREDPIYPVFTTDSPVFIKDFNISYAASANNNENTNQLDLIYSSLPSIDVEDDSYGWTVTAHLNIMCDSNKPQKIEVGSDNDQARQRITISGNTFPEVFYDELTQSEKMNVQQLYPQQMFKSSQAFSKDDGNNLIPITSDNSALYILSSIPLDKVGSSFIDVSYLDLLGGRHDTDIFAYDLNSEYINNTNGWQAVDAGLSLYVPAQTGITIDPEGEESHTFNDVAKIEGIKLASNFKHLLPVSTKNENIKFVIKSNGDRVKCICCGNDVFGGIKNNSKHFIQITPEMNNLTIAACNTDEDKEGHIVFEPLFRYNYRDIFGGNVIEDASGNQVLEYSPKYQVTTEDILDKIKKIDTEGKFKYTHIPSIDVEIKDPLDPISTFNENHVYNKFSIARADLDNAKPYDASYDIVNNK